MQPISRGPPGPDPESATLGRRFIRILLTVSPQSLPPDLFGQSDYTFPRPLEEEPNDKHLQSRHCHNQPTLHKAEVEDALLRALDRRKVAVLARAEVLLVAGDGRQLGRELEDGFFENRGLFGGGALFRGDFGAGGFVLNLEG
jgi:hypothetical protein